MNPAHPVVVRGVHRGKLRHTERERLGGGSEQGRTALRLPRVEPVLRLRVPVRVRRPASTRQALGLLPLLETCRAHSACVKGIPQISAVARPDVAFSRRPATARASDAWAGWLLVPLNLVIRRNVRSFDLRTHGWSCGDKSKYGMR